MKGIIILFAILGAAFCMPNGKSWNVPMPAPEVRAAQFYHVTEPVRRVKYVQEVRTAPLITGNLYSTQDTFGQYKYGYSSTDGQSKTEHRLWDGGVSGQFSYMSPDGKPITLSYIADKDGFKPVGEHLPKSPLVPPMPAELAAAYKEANDRLEKAREEIRLRGDKEPLDDGRIKEETKWKLPETPVYDTYIQKIPIMAAPLTYTYTYPTKSIFRAPVEKPLPVQEPLPVRKPVEYSSSSYSAEIGAPAPVTTYKTYSYPMKSIYVAAPAAPEPKRIAYSTSSYSTEIGAPAAPIITYRKEEYELPQKSIFLSAPAPIVKPIEYSSSYYTTDVGAEAPLLPSPPTPAPRPALSMKSGYNFNGGF